MARHPETLHTLFGASAAAEPRTAHFARSLLFHSLALALLLTLFLPKPAELLARAPHIPIDLRSNFSAILGGQSGGGQQQKTLASKGAVPLMTVPIVPPTVAPRNDDPALPVIGAVLGPATPVDLSKIGIPEGVNGLPSGGIGCCAGPGDSKGRSAGNRLGDHYALPGRGGVTVPVALYKPEPEYTDEARKVRMQGVVTLWAVVNEQGGVEQVRVYRGLGFGLDERAITAVRTWRFQPATKDGRPIAVQVYVDVDFRLF